MDKRITTRIGYGMGDIFGGGSPTLINMYYLYFLVDIVGLNPAMAGAAFLISKLWDAVTDPFMGHISDNTRTRFGRRRPYFLAGIFLVFLSFFIMWIPPEFNEAWKSFAWCLTAYVFFSTVFTMVWIPYNSIAAELTADYDERTRLSTWRMLFSNLSGILAAILPKDLFENTLFPGDPRRAYFFMALSFGLFFALPYIVTFLTCRENPEFMKLPRKKLGSPAAFFNATFLEPFRNRPFRNILSMYLFGFMAQDAVLAMAVFFLAHRLGISSMMTLLVPVYGGLLFFLPIVSKLGERIGKKNTFVLSGCCWIFALVLTLFMYPGMPMGMMYLFGAIFGAGLAGVQTMVFAAFPDIPDADELVSGRRREGMYSGIFALMRKAGSAFIIFSIGVLMDLAGYLPPVAGIARQQSEAFRQNLGLMFVVLPVICIIASMIGAWKYPLTREKLETVRGIIEARRKGVPLSEEQNKAREELIPIITGTGNIK